MDYDDQQFYMELQLLCKSSSLASRVNNGDIAVMLELVKQELTQQIKEELDK